MNIDELTLGQIKEIQALSLNINQQNNDGINFAIGKKVIIRTHSAGVWFGELEQKAGNEVILKNARRMWQWWAAESISLSGVAKFGIKQDKSKIAPAVNQIWLEAIEILPCTDVAIKSIEEAKDAQAE